MQHGVSLATLQPETASCRFDCELQHTQYEHELCTLDLSQGSSACAPLFSQCRNVELMPMLPMLHAWFTADMTLFTGTSSCMSNRLTQALEQRQ